MGKRASNLGSLYKADQGYKAFGAKHKKLAPQNLCLRLHKLNTRCDNSRKIDHKRETHKTNHEAQRLKMLWEYSLKKCCRNKEFPTICFTILFN